VSGRTEIDEHDRSQRPRLRLRAGAVVLALAAAGLLAGCAREAAPPAAPFGGLLAQPLPHRDVLGFLALDPDAAASLSRRQLNFGPTDLLKQASVLLPAVTLLKLAGERGVVESGGCVAVLFLDTDVHGGIAACAWRGDAEALRAAARAAQIPIDPDGRLLLPGRGRARDLDLLTDALNRQTLHGDDSLPSEVVMPAPSRRHRDTPRVTYTIVERGGIVLVLPAADGERNVLDTLEATRLLDVEAGRRPCLRLVNARIEERYRDTLGSLLNTAVNSLLTFDHETIDESYFRVRMRAWSGVTGLLDAISSVDEIFVQRDGAVWRAYLRERPDSFGARLLELAVNRPVAELLADLPDGPEWIAGRFDPDAVAAVPEQWRLSRAPVFRRMGPRNPYMVRSSRADEEVRREEERASDFLQSITGRFWCAGTLDAAVAGGRGRGGVKDFDADSIGATRLATFFERKPDAEPVGLFTTLLDTLVPKTWRDPIRVGSLLVYRSAPLERGSLEVVAQQPDRALRETIAAMARGGVAPSAAAPGEAFLALRSRFDAASGLAGDLYATHVGLGIELRFVPASP
jgi:hypothetical protein